MKDDFRNIKVINPKRLIKSIQEKDYLIYDCFGGESRGMTTDDLIKLINDEPTCTSLGVCCEDLQEDIPQYDSLYPFDGGSCNKCENSRFYKGDTYCSAYQKRCPSVRGCEKYKACDTGGIQ